MLSDGDTNSGTTTFTTTPSASIKASPFMCMYFYCRNWKYTMEICPKSRSNGDKYGMLTKRWPTFKIKRAAFALQHLSPALVKKPSKSIMIYFYKWRGEIRHDQGPVIVGDALHWQYKFNNHSQEQTESIDTYVTTLRALAETCEFGT